MVGNPAIPVVADAILKRIGGFDRALAYEAMRQSAMLDERGLEYYKEYGYIPFDKYGESVATALEYAIADWALAQVASIDGHAADFDYFNERSKTYLHYFDHETGFLRGRDSHGRWRTPFDPFASTHREDDYTEGNAWQYTFLVPHDVEGLAAEFGGAEPFLAKLDSLFVAQGDLGAEASPDISGLIGQYAHGNEPSHHAIYLYTMAGEPAKAAVLVRRVLNEMYHDAPDGLSGNEDVGQMSAWYVLSALGFYQVEPAGGRYFFGSPVVDGAVINVGGGKTFTINVSGNSPQNPYIQSITLNGREYSKPFIDFVDMAAGGEMTLSMGDTPAKWY
jgi:predicted alpha-1,2-mannosidase